jgi:Mor family transcriptional regulator
MSHPFKQSTRNEEVRERYRAGETITSLAATYGVSRKRIYQLLRAHPRVELRSVERWYAKNRTG